MYMLITCDCMLCSYVKEEEGYMVTYMRLYVWWSNCYKSKWPMFNVLFCLFVYLLYFAVLWCLLTLLSCLLLTVCLCFDGVDDDDDDDIEDDCAAIPLALFRSLLRWKRMHSSSLYSSRFKSFYSYFPASPSLHLPPDKTNLVGGIFLL